VALLDSCPLCRVENKDEEIASGGSSVPVDSNNNVSVVSQLTEEAGPQESPSDPHKQQMHRQQSMIPPLSPLTFMDRTPLTTLTSLLSAVMTTSTTATAPYHSPSTIPRTTSNSSSLASISQKSATFAPLESLNDDNLYNVSPPFPHHNPGYSLEISLSADGVCRGSRPAMDNEKSRRQPFPAPPPPKLSLSSHVGPLTTIAESPEPKLPLALPAPLSHRLSSSLALPVSLRLGVVEASVAVPRVEEQKEGCGESKLHSEQEEQMAHQPKQCYLSLPQKSPSQKSLAPTTFTQPESPTIVMVNLNAKTFSGSRRDRMRPRANMQRRISAPSLLQLGSLGGTSPQAAAGETDTSSDATCAPNNNGGSSSNNAGSLWNSLSSFHSSCDSLEHMDTMPPHATATTTTYTSGTGGLPSNATLGGGMTMRLRGVDP